MTKYLLAIACCDLKWKGGSAAKVSLIDSESGEESQIGQTELESSVNPIYRKMMDLTCQHPDSDLIKVTILDEHGESRGVGTFTVSKIKEHPKKLGSLQLSADRGTIVVHVTERSDEGTLKLALKGKDLKNVEGPLNLRKSDPFYILSRPGPTASGWSPIHTSEKISNNLNPEWSEVELKIRELCNGDFEQPLKLEVFDSESFGKAHKPMGSLITCADQLVSVPPDQGIALKTDDEHVGDILVNKAELHGCIDNKKEAKELMEEVAIALQTRSEANAKAQELELAREGVHKAKEALEAARLEAENKHKELEAVEDEWSKAMAVAATALSAIGGL